MTVMTHYLTLVDLLPQPDQPVPADEEEAVSSEDELYFEPGTMMQRGGRESSKSGTEDIEEEIVSFCWWMCYQWSRKTNAADKPPVEKTPSRGSKRKTQAITPGAFGSEGEEEVEEEDVSFDQHTVYHFRFVITIYFYYNLACQK